MAQPLDGTDTPITAGDFTLSTVVSAPPWYQNAYIIRHDPSGAQVVVDPGTSADRILQAAEAQAKAKGGEGAAIQAIWLTHAHPDHISGCAEVQQTCRVPVRLHRDEMPNFKLAPELARMMGQPLTLPSQPEEFDTHSRLTLGPAEITLIPTPGHTSGGVCFVFASGDNDPSPLVLTGDTLFNQGVGRVDLPGGDGPTLVNSIDHLLDSLPAEARLFSGHGPSWTTAQAKPWWQTIRSQL
ncbi:MBL fold metallo-hydrolase [Roseospirillum parvum]|uniref:Glyoxylase, beta-lactamase superfamily II n=1 Tax=Roseospirillum parvum TaxID=83401 RepID=A0A1G8D310_9PROT|nr:MBL fold metallo-hydrolase [Roseospirillum parvum]SDH52072.1 Glyoxylase, beta-lactamase superfamily II [Roseospirillum parvum]